MAASRQRIHSLPPEKAYGNIVSYIKKIELDQRGGLSIEECVKPHEAKRVKEAFDIMHEVDSSGESRSAERRDKFRHFLLQLDDDELVVASVLGIGKTAIANLKKADRLNLPKKLKENKRQFGSRFLRILAQKYSRSGKTSLIHS